MKNFLEEAKKAAGESLCIRAESNIGAVAVRGGEVIARGWNGAVGNIRPCSERGFCIRKERGIASGTQREIAYCICAEQRMICHAAREGIALGGAEVYVTHFPCATCVRLMVEAGIKRVFYGIDYPNPFSREIAEEAGFELIKLDC